MYVRVEVVKKLFANNKQRNKTFGVKLFKLLCGSITDLVNNSKTSFVEPLFCKTNLP